MNAPSVIVTENLTKSFGPQRAVDGLSLDVRQGDTYGLLGLNGAGKTTTLRLILGLLRPDSGRVVLLGEDDGAGRRRALARMGCMVEGPAFYGHLSGLANLLLLGSLSGPVSRPRCQAILDRVGLGHAAGKRARDYSLGMKQRLGIALALVSAPEIVILDEPTNGLDPNGILEMRRLIQQLNREDGVTFVISSHLLHEIEMVCNRVAMLEDGRLVLEESLDALLLDLSDRFALRARPVETAARVLRAADGIRDLEGPDGDGVCRFRGRTEALPALHRALAAADVAVFTLAEERVSLEEFFLSRSSKRREGVLT